MNHLWPHYLVVDQSLKTVFIFLVRLINLWVLYEAWSPEIIGSITVLLPGTRLQISGLQSNTLTLVKKPSNIIIQDNPSAMYLTLH